MIDNNLKHREVHIKLEPTTFEFCSVEVKTENSKLLLLSIYRPPNGNSTQFCKEINELMNMVKGNHDHIIVGLDHNLDLLKLHIHSSTLKFFEDMLDLELYPCITRPTRITKSSATLIDNIFVSGLLHDTMTASIVTCDLSNHLPCKVVLGGVRPLKNSLRKKELRRLSNKNIQKIADGLTSINWHEELDTKSSNDSFNKFHDLLCKQIDKISPLEIVTCKPKSNEKPWETASVRRSNKKCKQLFNKTLTKTATTVEINKYKHYRTVLNKVKRSLKMSYYTHKCIEFKSNSKKLWDIINKMVTKCNEKMFCHRKSHYRQYPCV